MIPNRLFRVWLLLIVHIATWIVVILKILVHLQFLDLTLFSLEGESMNLLIIELLLSSIYLYAVTRLFLYKSDAFKIYLFGSIISIAVILWYFNLWDWEIDRQIISSAISSCLFLILFLYLVKNVQAKQIETNKQDRGI